MTLLRVTRGRAKRTPELDTPAAAPRAAEKGTVETFPVGFGPVSSHVFG